MSYHSSHESVPSQGIPKRTRFTEQTLAKRQAGAASSSRSSGTTANSQYAKAYFLEDRFNNSMLVRGATKGVQHLQRRQVITGLLGSLAKSKRRWHGAPVPKTFLARLVSSFWFECWCALMIVLNTVALTVIVDLEARNRSTTSITTFFDWLDFSFSAWFFLELVLRIVGLRVLFFKGEDGLVNCVDLLFVPVFVVVATISVVVDGENLNSSDFSFLRVYRFLRFLKVIRFSRPLRLLPWARLLAGTLQFCCRYCLPTILLALCLPYVASLIILSAVGYTDSSSDLQDHWGSVLTAMVSLLATSCGGADWDVTGKSLKASGTLPYFMMLLHALLFRLVIVNVIACGYMQSTLDQMHLNARHNMHLLLESADTYVASLHEIFLGDHHVGNVS